MVEETTTPRVNAQHHFETARSRSKRFSAAKFPGRPDAMRALINYYATPAMHDHAAAVIATGLAAAPRG